MELTEAAARTESAKLKSPVQAMPLAALARAEQAIGHAARAAALALQAGDRAARLAIPGEPSCWLGYCLLGARRIPRISRGGIPARAR